MMNLCKSTKPRNSITFLNMTGDVTIAWDSESEEAILKLVEQKLKEGYSFFVLQPRRLGFIPLPSKKVAVTTVAQAREAGYVSMSDSDALRALSPPIHSHRVDDVAVEAVLDAGNAQIVKPEGNFEQTDSRRLTKADEIIRQQTIAIRRIIGG